MLLSLGFEKLALVRIYALHDQRNHRSGRVMEKIGMKVEAQIPAARRFRGQVVDEVMRELPETSGKTNHVKENRYGNND